MEIDTTDDAPLLGIRAALGPDLAEIVAAYSLVPTGILEGVHWGTCAANPAYAEWFPLLELALVCAAGDRASCEWLVRHYVPRGLEFGSAEAFWDAATVGGGNPYVPARSVACGTDTLRALPLVMPPAAGTRGQLMIECGALRAACLGRRLDIAKWLHVECRFAADDLRSGYNRVLAGAADGGSFEVLGWLMTEFGLSGADASEAATWDSAATRGDISTTSWMIGAFGVRSAGGRSIYAAAASAIYRGHLHIAQLLMEACKAAGCDASRNWLINGARRAPCPEAARFWLGGV